MLGILLLETGSCREILEIKSTYFLFCQGLYALEGSKRKTCFHAMEVKIQQSRHKGLAYSFWGGEYIILVQYFLYLWLWRPLHPASAVVASPLNPSIAAQIRCCVVFGFVLVFFLNA